MSHVRFCGLIVGVIVVALSSGCVPTPEMQPDATVVLRPGGTYVLCEGLWQQNNAVLSYIAPSQQIRDAVAGVDPAERLGDTASDLMRIGDALFIVVSTSRQLVMLDAGTAVIRRRVPMPNVQPYRMCSNGTDKVWITNLGDDSITEVKALDGSVSVPRVHVGPAPEGICALRSSLYVGLSGMGDLRKDEAGAGTIVVLRQSDLAAVDTIGSVPNVADLVSDPGRDVVWASYRHVASEPDSLGGVVLINGTTRTIVRRWRFAAPTDLVVDPSTGMCYVLYTGGIDELHPIDGQTRRVVTHTSGNGSDVWYSLSFDVRTRTLLVGNARSYVTDGELIEVGLDGAIKARYPVGLNPRAFAY